MLLGLRAAIAGFITGIRPSSIAASETNRASCSAGSSQSGNASSKSPTIALAETTDPHRQ
jgi:hypothetical protein